MYDANLDLPVCESLIPSKRCISVAYTIATRLVVVVVAARRSSLIRLAACVSQYVPESASVCSLGNREVL